MKEPERPLWLEYEDALARQKNRRWPVALFWKVVFTVAAIDIALFCVALVKDKEGTDSSSLGIIMMLVNLPAVPILFSAAWLIPPSQSDSWDYMMAGLVIVSGSLLWGLIVAVIRYSILCGTHAPLTSSDPNNREET
jgi:hypothetical protein